MTKINDGNDFMQDFSFVKWIRKTNCGCSDHHSLFLDRHSIFTTLDWNIEYGTLNTEFRRVIFRKGLALAL